ncbi:hypothetical protein KQX54_004550 [Cotesia glomerata]|uniref:Uncharacterized protein n=1 Tax=Cotesia glomerata TaxID=32391 RepID=A0AAV7HGZ6_COTGL|nr:hypothetical protein KQX54_004550 [Cotesia glomerata]
MYTTGERWNGGDNKLVDEKIVGMSTGHLPGLIRNPYVTYDYSYAYFAVYRRALVSLCEYETPQDGWLAQGVWSPG